MSPIAPTTTRPDHQRDEGADERAEDDQQDDDRERIEIMPAFRGRPGSRVERLSVETPTESKVRPGWRSATLSTAATSFVDERGRPYVPAGVNFISAECPSLDVSSV